MTAACNNELRQRKQNALWASYVERRAALFWFTAFGSGSMDREARSTNIPSPRTTARRKFNACMRTEFLAGTGQRITFAGNRKPKRLEAAENFHKTLNLPGPGVPA